MPVPITDPYAPPGFTAPGIFSNSAAEDEACSLLDDCERIGDWFYSLSRRSPSDMATPGWLAELRKLVIKADLITKGFG